MSLEFSNQPNLRPNENHLLILGKLPFLNNCKELINVPHFFHDPSVTACLFNDFKFDDRTVLTSFTNPIKSKIFNFNKLAHNLDLKVSL